MKMKALSLSGASALVLFILFLSACDASETENVKKPSPVQSVDNSAQPLKPSAQVPEETKVPQIPEALTPNPLVEVLEKKEVVRSYYNARGRRDPFQSVVNSQSLGKQARIFGSLPPLQRKDISDLKLIGIVWGSFGPRAIITTSSGKGYTVRIGTRIGLNRGVIKEITQNEVLIEETILNVFGEPRKSEVVMVLHSEKERLE